MTLYTLQEASDQLRISIRTLRTYIAQGKIKAVDVSKSQRKYLRIKEEDLLKFLNS